jgi:hypothetical protein
MALPRVLITAAVPAALVLSGTMAQAMASPEFVSATPRSCSSHTLRIPFTGTIITARRAGQSVTNALTFRNVSTARLTRVFFDYELDSPSRHRGPTPTMSWRLDHRRWHALPLPFWTPQSTKTNAFWESKDTVVGTIAAHSRHRLQMRITFHSRDHSGIYDGQAGFGAPACSNGGTLIGFGEINFAYQPS